MFKETQIILTAIGVIVTGVTGGMPEHLLHIMGTEDFWFQACNVQHVQ